jgi:glycerol-3-phosphate acyltransferase PlsX
MRIAVDVMGGDHGCGVVIEGAKRALQANKSISTLYLVGDKVAIHAALPKRGFRDPRVRVIHASEVLTMDDKPAAAIRKKKDCSVARAIDLLEEGKADAVVSPGNTGGIFAASTFKLGRIPGVDRGAIATVMPRPDGEFVGILSIGTEDTKGNELTLQAFKLCKHLDINFIGNVEGHDLFREGVDVVVCDGFVGNVVLKSCESLATAIFTMLKRELTFNLQRQLGALLVKNAFRSIKKRMDPEAYGGAPLLGFNGAVLKAHGSAKERAIASAIGVMIRNLKHQVNEAIARDIALANEKLAAIAEGLPVATA